VQAEVEPVEGERGSRGGEVLARRCSARGGLHHRKGLQERARE
jgi:hypothetical protein